MNNINPSRLLLVALLSFGALSCADHVQYLDPNYPGLTPKKYAVGIINIPARFQQNLTMTADGREVLFTETNSEEWRYERILRIKFTEEKWEIDTPRFVNDFQFESEWFIGEPMISQDNNELFFVADYPPNIWRSKRLKDGDWGKPRKMQVSTKKDDWYPTQSKSGTLYFTNGTAFFSEKEEDTYLSRKHIATPLDTLDVRDPVVAPDEDYIIFASRPDPKEEQTDLYVSFAKSDGSWSQPINMGERINTNQLEFSPYISPDEKFLFFSRRDQWINAESSNIFWVSLEVIHLLKDGK